VKFRCEQAYLNAAARNVIYLVMYEKSCKLKKNQPERRTFNHTFVAVRYQLSVFKLRKTHKVANLKTYTF